MQTRIGAQICGEEARSWCDDPRTRTSRTVPILLVILYRKMADELKKSDLAAGLLQGFLARVPGVPRRRREMHHVVRVPFPARLFGKIVGSQFRKVDSLRAMCPGASVNVGRASAVGTSSFVIHSASRDACLHAEKVVTAFVSKHTSNARLAAVAERVYALAAADSSIAYTQSTSAEAVKPAACTLEGGARSFAAAVVIPGFLPTTFCTSKWALCSALMEEYKDTGCWGRALRPAGGDDATEETDDADLDRIIAVWGADEATVRLVTQLVIVWAAACWRCLTEGGPSPRELDVRGIRQLLWHEYPSLRPATYDEDAEESGRSRRERREATAKAFADAAAETVAPRARGADSLLESLEKKLEKIARLEKKHTAAGGCKLQTERDLVASRPKVEADIARLKAAQAAGPGGSVTVAREAAE